MLVADPHPFVSPNRTVLKKAVILISPTVICRQSHTFVVQSQRMARGIIYIFPPPDLYEGKGLSVLNIPLQFHVKHKNVHPTFKSLKFVHPIIPICIDLFPVAKSPKASRLSRKKAANGSQSKGNHFRSHCYQVSGGVYVEVVVWRITHNTPVSIKFWADAVAGLLSTSAIYGSLLPEQEPMDWE